jgi:hypothetical protein
MIVSRLRPPGSAKLREAQEGRKRSRPWRYIFWIFGAGVVSGTAALAGIPPFGSLQALLAPISNVLHPPAPPAPIQASTIFPAIPPVHKRVDVYDPPPPPRRAVLAPQPPAAAPTPKTHPSPTPPLSSSPSPTPHGGD